MNLPVESPVLPMLAKRVSKLPNGPEWIYEPKWDGFRAIVFRAGNDLLLQSRDEKPLNRYFPELLDPLREQLPNKCVLDGEIVISINGALDFDALQLRIHPAASRVALLSRRTPASIVFFDLSGELLIFILSTSRFRVAARSPQVQALDGEKKSWHSPILPNVRDRCKC